MMALLESDILHQKTWLLMHWSFTYYSHSEMRYMHIWGNGIVKLKHRHSLEGNSVPSRVPHDAPNHHQLIQINIKVPHYWHFVRGIHQRLMDFPHRGLIMKTAFMPWCHYETMRLTDKRRPWAHTGCHTFWLSLWRTLDPTPGCTFQGSLLIVGLCHWRRLERDRRK